MSKDILLFGMQGSGKGTQAEILSDKYGFIHFETGDCLRKKSLEKDYLGIHIKEIINRGDFVSDEVVTTLVSDFLSKIDIKKKLIFDGLIRKKSHLDTVFKKLKEDYNRDFLVLVIDFDQKTALSRLTKRLSCLDCGHVFKGEEGVEICNRCGGKLAVRQDDKNRDVLIHRIDNYDKETLPVLDFLKSKNYDFLKVDGRKTIEEVSQEIEEGLKKLSII